MFGSSFFNEVLELVKYKFGYNPSEYQLTVLKTISKEAERSWKNGTRSKDGAQLVAAIKFMLVQLSALTGASPSTKSFIEKHSNIIMKLMEPYPGMAEGALQQLNPIRLKHGLTALTLEQTKNASANRSPSNRAREDRHTDFDSWYAAFKHEFEKQVSRIQPYSESKSVFDWLEHEQLKSAFEEDMAPEQLAVEIVKLLRPEDFYPNSRKGAEAPSPRQHDDLELALEYFHSVAKFVLEKADFDHREVRISQTEAYALRQSFCEKKANWGLVRVVSDRQNRSKCSVFYEACTSDRRREQDTAHWFCVYICQVNSRVSARHSRGKGVP